MTDPISVLDDPRPGVDRVRVRRLPSRQAIRRALAGSKRREVWVLPTAEAVEELIHAMALSPSRVSRARLVSYARPEPSALRILDACFGRSLLGTPAMVGFDDLKAVMATPHPGDYCIGAEWDAATNSLALWRGDLSFLLVPMSAFPVRGGVAPDPARLSIEDSGQTVRMGEYEASVDAILFARDPVYRRRARKRMRQEEQGLGPSIRRLRASRGVGRGEFPGIDEKTLARLERGEIERPQQRTLVAIAKKLGVSVENLGAY